MSITSNIPQSIFFENLKMSKKAPVKSKKIYKPQKEKVFKSVPS
jgi:hypothetical protein